MDDWNLLQQFAGDGSKQALDELVRRHLDMVYATALREMGDVHLAEDVTQAAFIVLMRRAGSISPKVNLAGWLFKVTRFAAADARKGQSRRESRERKAAAMKSEIIPPDHSVEARELFPLLNDAIASLPAAGRDAVIMGYLQGKSHREIAGIQRITENAVRQRLFGAMKYLRSYFKKKGVEVTEEAVTSAFSVSMLQKASASLAGRVNPSLITSAGTNAAMIAKATIGTLVMSQFKMAAMILLMIVIFLAVSGGIVIHAMTPAVEEVTMGSAQASSQTSTQPTTQPERMIGPKELVMGYLRAAGGDEEGFVKGFTQLTRQQAISARTVARAMSIAGRLDGAVSAVFHEDHNWEIFRSLGMAVTRDDLQTATENISGDMAVIHMEHATPSDIPLIRVNRCWRAPALIVDGFDMTEMNNTVSKRARFERVIADVQAGKYKTFNDVRKALTNNMVSAWYFKPVWTDSTNSSTKP